MTLLLWPKINYLTKKDWPVSQQAMMDFSLLLVEFLATSTFWDLRDLYSLYDALNTIILYVYNLNLWTILSSQIATSSLK